MHSQKRCKQAATKKKISIFIQLDVLHAIRAMAKKKRADYRDYIAATLKKHVRRPIPLLICKMRKVKSRVPYFVEIPALGLVTQGRTIKEAHLMAKDVVEAMINDKKFKLRIIKESKTTFYLEPNNIATLFKFWIERNSQLHRVKS